ncbi:hypothetical protein AX16_004380 [Volvariella volvacea WC 439]|nr:hypothetical protein AX16_004380 [Volvariella volvacea WC 439]
MASDPRVHKPRLPKVYTDQQLAFLKSHLPEFERRSQGSVRGDAKKFALERASDFISRFGLPNEFVGLGTEESESRFREQIYNWFKNTVGRTRRKLEGRPRSGKKLTEKANSPSGDLTWNTSVPAPATIIPYSQPEATSSPVTTSQPIIASVQSVQPVQYGGMTQSTPIQQPLPPPAPSPHNHTININITQPNLRDAFLQGADPSTLASMIQSFTMSNPSPIPLTAVIEAMFEAISSAAGGLNINTEPHAYLRRLLDASAYFPMSMIHAGTAGPLAVLRALQMQIRKHSTWVSYAPSRIPARPGPPQNAAAPTSMNDEVQRIAADRQRRKDYIQWAYIHAAALELGMMAMGSDTDHSGYGNYALSRVFSEMVARDAVWESDEVEWVAGICVLRAVIRTAVRGDRRQRDEYDELLRTYEGRWKEIKDETRQGLVTVCIPTLHSFDLS